jgi:hypothetical protein
VLTANFFKKSLITNLLGKGLIENPGSGVINRRNGCGAAGARTLIRGKYYSGMSHIYTSFSKS